MDAITKLIVISLLNENLISEAKIAFKSNTCQWEFISIITGTTLSFIFGQDIFTSLGIMPNENIPPIISFIFVNIATGFLIGRGSNVIYKFLSILDLKKNNLQNQTNSQEVE